VSGMGDEIEALYLHLEAAGVHHALGGALALAYCVRPVARRYRCRIQGLRAVPQ